MYIFFLQIIRSKGSSNDQMENKSNNSDEPLINLDKNADSNSETLFKGDWV